MTKTNFVLAASLAVLLSACGQKESEEPVAPPAPTTTPAPAPADTPAAPPASTAPESTTPATPAPTAPESTAPSAPDTAAAPAAPAPAPTASAAADGASVYNKTCALCHAAGVAGAPKPGDKEDWGPRIAQGKETLYKHAIEGFTGQKGMMPPRGGGASLTDEQVKAAVDYMVGKSS